MKRKLGVFAAVLLAAVVVAACGSGGVGGTLQKNQNVINGDVTRLQAVEPLPHLLDSANLRIQNYYYTAEADPNKIWYLETLSQTGSVEGSYTIRGPVENVSDQVTNPQQVRCVYYRSTPSCHTIGLAEPNAIYPGPSADHIAILVSGGILRFEGFFQTSDQPFTIKTPETITIDGKAPITSTDLSKTQGGKLPPRK